MFHLQTHSLAVPIPQAPFHHGQVCASGALKITETIAHLSVRIKRCKVPEFRIQSHCQGLRPFFKVVPLDTRAQQKKHHLPCNQAASKQKHQKQPSMWNNIGYFWIIIRFLFKSWTWFLELWILRDTYVAEQHWLTSNIKNYDECKGFRENQSQQLRAEDLTTIMCVFSLETIIWKRKNKAKRTTSATKFN